MNSEQERKNKKKMISEASKITTTAKIAKKLNMKIPYQVILNPLGKLVKAVKINDTYHKLREQGHSVSASAIGTGSALIAKSAAISGGAVMFGVGAGINAVPGVGTAASPLAMTSGVFFISKSDQLSDKSFSC